MKIFSFLQKAPSVYAKAILEKIEKPGITAPKRPVNPFIMFSKRQLPVLMSEKKKLGNAVQTISEQWKEMSDEEKRPYFEEYEKAKLEYQEKYQEYISKRTSSDAYLETEAWTLKKQAGIKTVRPPVDKNKPFKPLNPFIRFCMDVRNDPSLFGLSFPDKSLKETSKVLGLVWKDLEFSKKEKYVKEYEEEMKNFKEKFQEYISKIQDVKDSLHKSVLETRKNLYSTNEIVPEKILRRNVNM